MYVGASWALDISYCFFSIVFVAVPVWCAGLHVGHRRAAGHVELRWHQHVYGRHPGQLVHRPGRKDLSSEPGRTRCVRHDTASDVFGVRTRTRAVDKLVYCIIFSVNKSPLYIFVHRRLLISVNKCVSTNQQNLEPIACEATHSANDSAVLIFVTLRYARLHTSCSLQ